MTLSTINRMRVGLLIGATAAATAAGLALAADGLGNAMRDHLGMTLAFLAATVLLQLFAIKVPGRGCIGVGAVGLVASGIVLGPGAAMSIAVAGALVQWVRSRGLAHRAIFDASNFALAAGAAAVAFDAIDGLDGTGIVRLGAALIAGVVFGIVNVGLLCLAMAASESRSPLAVWLERFHWSRFHLLAFGPLALLAATAYASLGAASLLAFVLPPVLLALLMRESLARFRRTALAAA